MIKFFLNIKIKKNSLIHIFNKVRYHNFPKTYYNIHTNKNIKKETLETFLKNIKFFKKKLPLHTSCKVQFRQFPRDLHDTSLLIMTSLYMCGLSFFFS